MKVLLVGFGTVGQGLVTILRDKAPELRERYGFAPRIVGVATRSRGTLYHPDGLDPALLLDTFTSGYPESTGAIRDWPLERLIREGGADVLVEATPTDLTTAQPALDTCRAALDAGHHLVLANKGPIALAYAELRDQAARLGKRLLFEGTVMAGTPSLRLGMQALAGCTIREARGILNGTTNYMLTQMEAGRDYTDVLAEAQRLGYAEADPTADVDGWDAAGKAIILAAALFGQRLTFADMTVSGIRGLSSADIAAAAAAGERWKLIAHITPQGGSVRAVRLPAAHPLAGVNGTTNAVTYSTDLLGDVTLIGAGAGGVQTGFGLLSDLLELHRQVWPA
ncbi:MAG: homoserine dehydrogenase [bacterium]|nr:homoserine dehydrogenase [bacterium]